RREEIKSIKYENIKRISLNDSILMLLSAMDYNKKIISRTLFQREVFLFYEDILKDLGISKGAVEAGFFPYKYGPYSIDVNLSLSTLIFSGVIQVDNFYKSQEGKNKRSFLTVFTTGEDFDKVAKKYEDIFIDKGVTLENFRKILCDRKHAWDQSEAKGIAKLLISKGFKEWYNKKSLDDSYPLIHFGKIREEFRPRVSKWL
ncbi:hypothetical protein, partial [Ferroplasma sp. Type II]|uniref:hypothetical protein n=1 Tax=Ferroplasma sp. Type II TaxID=261388 RepID=UPI0025C2038E